MTSHCDFNLSQTSVYFTVEGKTVTFMHIRIWGKIDGLKVKNSLEIKELVEHEVFTIFQCNIRDQFIYLDFLITCIKKWSVFLIFEFFNLITYVNKL